MPFFRVFVSENPPKNPKFPRVKNQYFNLFSFYSIIKIYLKIGFFIAYFVQIPLAIRGFLKIPIGLGGSGVKSRLKIPNFLYKYWPSDRVILYAFRVGNPVLWTFSTAFRVV